MQNSYPRDISTQITTGTFIILDLTTDKHSDVEAYLQATLYKKKPFNSRVTLVEILRFVSKKLVKMKITNVSD